MVHFKFPQKKENNKHIINSTDLKPLLDEYSLRKLKKVFRNSGGMTLKAQELLKKIYMKNAAPESSEDRSFLKNIKEALFLKIVLSNMSKWQKDGLVAQKEVLLSWTDSAKWFLVDSDVNLGNYEYRSYAYKKLYSDRVREYGFFTPPYASFVSTSLYNLFVLFMNFVYDPKTSPSPTLGKIILTGASLLLLYTIPESILSYNKIRVSQFVNKIERNFKNKNK